MADKPAAASIPDNTAAKPADPAAIPNQVSTPAPSAAPKDADADKVSSRFAALSRKERAIVQKQQEVQAKEAALAEREAKVRAFEEEWAKDPTKAAESRGLTYAEWTQRVLNDGKPSPDAEVASVRKDIEALRKEREDERKAADAKKLADEQKRNEAVVAEFHAGVNKFIKDNAETYEFINLHEAQNLVISTIEEHFASTKEILDTKKACELVEKFLEEQVIKSTETKKFKAKAAPQPEGDPKQTPKPAPQQKTLTNNMTASAPGFLPAKTEKERISRALAALERTK